MDEQHDRTSAEVRNSPRPVGGHIVYTSGTTGTSKKLLIGADLVAGRIARNTAILAWPEEPVVHFNNFGLWTSVGFNCPQVVWNAGGRAIFDQRPDAIAHFLESDFDCGYLTPVLAQRLVFATKEADQEARDVVVASPADPYPAMSSRHFSAKWRATSSRVTHRANAS